MWLPLISSEEVFFYFFYSLFILHFNSSQFFFLLHEQKKKNQKRKLADCIFSAKNGSRFPKARKLASYACSNSPRFLTENAPHSLNAPKMRSDLTDFLLILSCFVAYGFLQHRFARLSVF